MPKTKGATNKATAFRVRIMRRLEADEYTREEIGAMLGVNQSSITYHLNEKYKARKLKTAVTKSKPHKHYTEVEKSLIRTAQKDGLELQEVAKIIGRPRMSVYKFVQRERMRALVPISEINCPLLTV